MGIADNYARIQERIAEACSKAGRSAESVQVMAVSKTHPAEAIAEAYAAGLRIFGENRVQEFQQKRAAIADLKDARFHLIGNLQSNKSAKAAEIFDAVDTVDSLKIAQRLNDAAGALGKKLAVLIEIKLSSEPTKHGIVPELVSPLLEEAVSGLPHLEFRGLMTVPPYFNEPERARPYFNRLRKLRDGLAEEFPEFALRELSMGMSHDFEVAIAEGSTCVRIGTALFGKRG